ncbi:MAG: M48 family metalloprotease [Alphaproteobacteria bacterium]|nr:M48 family metalloprotease [Alphaproteobacteria bacterium]
MSKERSKFSFIYLPKGAEKDIPLPTRAVMAKRGVRHAHLIDEESHPDLKETIDGIATKAEVKGLNSYLLQGKKLGENSFGFSFGKPVLGVSETALDLFNSKETSAVIAHEMGHIKNGLKERALISVEGIVGAAAGWFGAEIVKDVFEKPSPKPRDILADKDGSDTMLLKYVGVLGGAAQGSLHAARENELKNDRFSASIEEGNGVALMSAASKALRIPHEKLNGSNIASSIKSVFSAHPSLRNRMKALDVTPEDIAEFQAKHDDGQKREPVIPQQPESNSQAVSPDHLKKDNDERIGHDASDKGGEKPQWRSRVEQDAAADITR